MSANQVFEDAKWIIEALENQGHHAYFVGGSVRDYLMDKHISDVDITTSALPEEVESIFDKTLPIGKEHGTIIVLGSGQQFEVTTFRKDGDYVDHRRPTSVQFVTDLYEDVARRDFTMNAIAMDKSYQLHDYFNGLKDINNKIIKAVGTPIDRMEEDALRIMRGVRFQAQTGFNIDDETKEAMSQSAHLLDKIAIERIVVELKKMISGNYVYHIIQTMKDMAIFKYIPFFKNSNLETIFIPQHSNFELWIASLCYIYHLELSSLNHLKISNKEKHEIISYYNLFNEFENRNISKVEMTSMIYNYGNNKVNKVIQFIYENNQSLNIQFHPTIMNTILVNEIYDKLPIYDKSDLSINGQIIMNEFNKNGGPWIKDILNKVEQAVILNKVNNTQNELIEWVRENVEI
ncbi:CCA tRNA nucleotidyltransferase [Mammaliicoccus fleurettii]|uniref:CCA tRNA nucleotidyltransferase n=1 Tax=Mammaliicoccus fleurettii TaxID=150056 RepID=UPI001AAD9130|nr:CCA tRNA nucleotidyltransferase [Mammaliicoccus fleurettii]MBO3062526.1 CCA tRNA nucleotidyltransferase [Mammaliicoccus fleurettii]MEB7779340.1 CCA tRNA nucleotidyltransferase [Mammaliicoccus fleurettii]MEB8067081.1 CCA tRNA nucleotidyltransferase [Mammaliicoccus fleurettii]